MTGPFGVGGGPRKDAGPTFSVHIGRPPEEVFDYLVDVSRHPEWSPDDMRVEPLDSGPVTVGSRFRTSGTLFGRRNHATVEVTRMQHPGRFAFVATDSRGPLTHEFTLTRDPAGTRVDRQLFSPPPSLAARLLFALLLPLAIRPNFMRGLHLLKERLEAGAPAPRTTS